MSRIGTSGVKTRRRRAEAAAALLAQQQAATGGAGPAPTIYIYGGSGGTPATNPPTTTTAAAAATGTAATVQGLNPGQYIDSQGKKRNADGTKVVSGKTLAARNASWWSGLPTAGKVGVVLGGVVVVVVLVKIFKPKPKTYLERVADAGRKAVDGVKQAAGV